METLLQKAQRLGIQPQEKQQQGNPVVEFGKGALKGIASTVQGMANIGQSTVGALGNTITGAITGRKVENNPLPQIPKQYTEASNTAQSVGKGAEQLAEWFIPASWFGKAAKGIEAGIGATKLAKSGGTLAKVSTGATKLAARAGVSGAEGAFVSGVQSGGNLEEMKKNAEFGATVPIVGRGLSTLWKGTKAVSRGVRSVSTGVKGEVFQRLKEAPDAYDDAMKHLSENPDTPFLGLSTSIASRLNALKESARQSYDDAKTLIRNSFAGTTFDLEHKIPALSKSLAPFNLAVKQARDKTGKMLGETFVVPTTRTSPYTQIDLNQISDIVRKMRTKNMTIDELTDFQESVKNFLGNAVKREDKKMIKLGYSLLGSSIKFVNEVAPQLKNANTLYENYYKALASGGNKIIDPATGEIKAGAETFLSNVQNMNKGSQKNALRYVEDATGIPIVDNVLVLKDAMKLNNLFPATGSRTQDILRSLATAGIGTAAGGLGVGSAVGLALSSPKFQAKLAIKAEQMLKKFPSLPPDVKRILQFFSGSKIEGKLSPAEKSIAGKVTSALDNPKAGMSIQDVSGGKAGYGGAKKVQYNLNGQWKTVNDIAKEYMKKTVATEDQAFDYARRVVKNLNGREYTEISGIPKKGEGEIRSTIVSKEDPLLQEAKKYKSAEEFVKAQGEPVYHGTDANVAGGLRLGKDGSPIWLSKTESGSERYGKNLIQVNAKNTKLLDETNLAGLKESRRILEESGAKSFKDTKFQNALQKAGYDGIRLGNGNDIAIFNPNSVKTKSQLTDIWKKAHKK